MAGTIGTAGLWSSVELRPRDRLLAMAIVIAVYLAVIGAVGALNRLLG